MKDKSMDKRDRFSEYNPIVNLIFYLGALVYSMIYMHPLFLAISFLGATSYYLTIQQKKAFKLIFLMIPLVILIACINPIFSTGGNTVLFYLWDRPYTLEAIIYGAIGGATFGAVVIWFATFNYIMTSDKLIYLFGAWIPNISMVFTMVLRFLPTYKRKLRGISTARECIGKSKDSGKKKERIANGLTEISALTSQALENGIVTADSMKSRGFGSGERKSFSLYTIKKRDVIFIVVFILIIILLAGCGIKGGMDASFIPQVSLRWNSYTFAGALLYGTMLFVPTILNVTEDIVWNFSKSKI